MSKSSRSSVRFSFPSDDRGAAVQVGLGIAMILGLVVFVWWFLAASHERMEANQKRNARPEYPRDFTQGKVVDIRTLNDRFDGRRVAVLDNGYTLETETPSLWSDRTLWSSVQVGVIVCHSKPEFELLAEWSVGACPKFDAKP